MADNNRYRNTSRNTENWDKNQGRYVDDNNYSQGYQDLDRDGYIGNAGGFYGGTSYTGSNYDDWNNNQYMRRHPSDNDYNDYRSRNEGSYKHNQYRNVNENPYQDYRSYGQYSNYGNEGSRNDDYRYRNIGNEYGSRWNDSYNRRSDYNIDSGYGSSYGMSDYGNDQSYNRTRYSDWQKDRDNTSYRDRSWYNDRNRNDDYDRNRNYDRSNNRNNQRDWWDRTRDEVASWFGDDDAERRRRMDERRSGAYRGKGPRQYQRSDERIKEDVCDRLSDDSFIDASDIDVTVEGNEVTLNGTVDSRTAKRRAEDLIENISGVKNVQNNLRVSQPATVGSSTIRSTTDTNTKSSTT